MPRKQTGIAVGRWTCPACGRTFGRNRQGHLCVPVNRLADYLAVQPVGHRAVFEAVLDVFAGLDEVIVEAANVGIFFKRSRRFAQVRPRRQWLVLTFLLRRDLQDDRVQSSVRASTRATAYRVRLRTPDDLDDDVRRWLMESYEAF
jgi:hypothetical protein